MIVCLIMIKIAGAILRIITPHFHSHVNIQELSGLSDTSQMLRGTLGNDYHYLPTPIIAPMAWIEYKQLAVKSTYISMGNTKATL